MVTKVGCPLYARFGDTAFESSEATCCSVWLSLQTMMAAKWNERLGLSNASKPLLLPLILPSGNFVEPQIVVATCAVPTLERSPEGRMRETRVIDTSRLPTPQKGFFYGNTNRSP